MVERSDQGLPPHGWSWGGGAENKVLGHKAGSRSKVTENREQLGSFKMMPEGSNADPKEPQKTQPGEKPEVTGGGTSY